MGMTDAVAIITLVGNGMGPSAMKLARSAMETAINAETPRLDPVAAEDFLEWHWVEQHRLTWAEQNDVEILASIGGPKIDEIETNYAKVRPRFLTQKGRVRSSWSAHKLDVRAEKAGFLDTYRLIHPLHANSFMEVSEGCSNISPRQTSTGSLPPPTHEWDRQALLSAHSSMLRLAQTLCLTFNTDTKPPLQELQDDYLRIWKE